MVRLVLVLSLFAFSLNSYAERCEGMNACTELYTKLTGHKVILGADISDDMTLAVPDTDLTQKNAAAEYKLFLNKNVVSLAGDKAFANRQGEFLEAPIYAVSEGNIPRMMNPKGLVTLVYHSKSSTSKLANATRAMLSKKMPAPKSPNKIVEFQDSKILAISDSYETAVKIFNQMLKLDK